MRKGNNAVGRSFAAIADGAVETTEELRQALLAFRDTYNTTRLIERHGFITPEAFRQEQLQAIAKAV